MWLYLLTTLAGCQAEEDHALRTTAVIHPQQSGTSVRLQAVSAVDENVVWASGLQGTYVRTTNGGATWIPGVVPGADSLQFRDVDAFDSLTAYLLAAGPGTLSRIYKTSDGGVTWALQFTNAEPTAFFDCMAFWDRHNGLAFSDAVDGEFPILRTADGEHWDRIPPAVVPDALPGEGSFAASGSCLVTQGDSTALFGTGASEKARVFKTVDRGSTWSVAETPLVSGSLAGIASLAFFDADTGLAAGGDIGNPAVHNDNIAVTQDGGSTWELAGRPVFSGAVYGLAGAAADVGSVLLAVGPGGLDYSLNKGMVWLALDTTEYWSAAFASFKTGWAVGPGGRVARIQLHER
jgi:photosystem II stability/assembly factor-like uncharacterized protein